jgi:hypothetical protein
VTPEIWRERAAEYDRRAQAAAEKGDPVEALVFARAALHATIVAEKLEEERAAKGRGLPARNTPRIMSGRKVTAAQLKRRGAAVARGWAAKGGSLVSKAITSSDYKTLSRYAKERLKISQPALSRYISGSLACPQFVADAVKQDFGLDHRVWPKGVVD